MGPFCKECQLKVVFLVFEKCRVDHGVVSRGYGNGVFFLFLFDVWLPYEHVVAVVIAVQQAFSGKVCGKSCYAFLVLFQGSNNAFNFDIVSALVESQHLLMPLVEAKWGEERERKRERERFEDKKREGILPSDLWYTQLLTLVKVCLTSVRRGPRAISRSSTPSFVPPFIRSNAHSI